MAAQDLALDAGLSTDEDALLPAPGAARPIGWRKKLAVAAAAAALGSVLAAGAVATSARWRAPSAPDSGGFAQLKGKDADAAKGLRTHKKALHKAAPARETNAPAPEQPPPPTLVKSQTACSNYANITLGPMTLEVDAEACRKRCFDVAGCTGFAFQSSSGHAKNEQCKKEMAQSNYVPWPGSCQPLRAECAVTDAPCYDVYKSEGSSQYAWYMRQANTRCENWEDIKLGDYMVTADAADCGALCMTTGGCKGFSYKRGNAYVFFSVVQGACTLRTNAECASYEDNDWDDYELQEQVPEAYALAAKGKGCTNWESIKIELSEKEPSPSSCAARCQLKPGCVGFGFNAGGQSCFLWNGTCQTSDDDQWDDYTLTPTMQRL